MFYLFSLRCIYIIYGCIFNTIYKYTSIKKIVDTRSYRQNSNKLILTGFKKKFSVVDAIKEWKEKAINVAEPVLAKVYEIVGLSSVWYPKKFNFF